MNPTYDITKTYEWNYENGPFFKSSTGGRPAVKKKLKLFDFEINSPIGVPAGPLLNANWIKLYAEIGWDIPVYKTVRTRAHQCHPAPNCIYVKAEKQLTSKDIGESIFAAPAPPEAREDLTITNSFGMPSKAPNIWMTDIEKANRYLGVGQVMVVSIVGTPGEGRSLAEDYARCAKMAKEAGAQIIEANYSCPNVCSGEGSIFMDAALSSEISKKIKKQIGNTPFMIKIGNSAKTQALEEVIKANMPFVDGVAGINTIAMKVYKKGNEQALPGAGRLTSGLCGAAIHDISLDFVKQLQALRKKHKPELVICGVGGIMTPQDMDQRITAGADIVMSATAAMWNPLLAQEYHKKVASNS